MDLILVGLMKRSWSGKRMAGILFVLAACGCAGGPAAETASSPPPAGDTTVMPSKQQGRPEYQPGVLLVKFRAEVTPQTIESLLAARHCKIRSVIGDIGVYVIELPPEIDVPAGMRLFNDLPEVEYAEPNYIRHHMK